MTRAEATRAGGVLAHRQGTDALSGMRGGIGCRCLRFLGGDDEREGFFLERVLELNMTPETFHDEDTTRVGQIHVDR